MLVNEMQNNLLSDNVVADNIELVADPNKILDDSEQSLPMKDNHINENIVNDEFLFMCIYAW
jgi:hypothetical protein